MIDARLIVITLVVALGCTDSSLTTSSIEAASALADAHGIPARTADPHSPWSRRSDAELWAALSASDSVAVVGLKAAGMARGVYLGEILLSADSAHSLRTTLAAERDVAVIRALPPLPVLLVKVHSERALERLRRLAFVDYVEPDRAPATASAALRLFDDGCGAPAAWSDDDTTTVMGDVVPWPYAMPYHQIERAWGRARGDGVTVGVLDTGVDPAQTQFFGRFTLGASGARSLTTLATYVTTPTPYWQDDCGHGTRVAGVIAAPHDGENMVGVAWRSNLVVVRVTGAVHVTTTQFIYSGINQAIANGAKVVQMAFGHFDGTWGSTTATSDLIGVDPV